MAPLPPATFVVRNLRYQPDPIDPHRNSECSEEAANIKPPCTVFPFRPLITARFPTKRGEPLAAVIKISPSCTKSIFVAFSSTNTSSSLKTNRSWLMLAERSTRIPLAQSVISAGVYVRPRLIVAMSSNLRCSQAGVEGDCRCLLSASRVTVNSRIANNPSIALQALATIAREAKHLSLNLKFRALALMAQEIRQTLQG